MRAAPQSLRRMEVGGLEWPQSHCCHGVCRESPQLLVIPDDESDVCSPALVALRSLTYWSKFIPSAEEQQVERLLRRAARGDRKHLGPGKPENIHLNDQAERSFHLPSLTQNRSDTLTERQTWNGTRMSSDASARNSVSRWRAEQENFHNPKSSIAS